jgi:hypothetical protein
MATVGPRGYSFVPTTLVAKFIFFSSRHYTLKLSEFNVLICIYITVVPGKNYFLKSLIVCALHNQSLAQES